MNNNAKLLLAAVIGLLSVPAHADLLQIDVTGVLYTAPGVIVNGQLEPLPSEHFNASFEWNTVTESVVNGSMTVNAVGPLETFVYSPTASTGSTPDLLFLNGVSDAISVSLISDVARPPVVFPPVVLPSIYPVFSTLKCGSATDFCGSNLYGFPQFGTDTSNGTMTVTAVPESSSGVLLSLALGALCAAVTRCRLKSSLHLT